jgi:hypothetical protein
MPRTPKPVPKPPSSAPLPMPHERDEATGQVGHTDDPVMRQARRDSDAGLVDTDMRATPGLDAERRNELVPTPAPQPQRRRRS